LQNHGTLGVLNQIFWNTLDRVLLPIKLGLFRENWNEWYPYIGGSGGTAPYSPNLGTSWSQVVRFMLQVFYSSWKWLLGLTE